MAPVQRVNSVAVSTARLAAVGKRLQQDDIVKMLVDCDYQPEHIVGIQYLAHRQIVIVKFKNSEYYSKFLELNTVKVNGVPCKLFDMSSSYTIVTVLGAPFEMVKEDIAAILSRYGRVHSIRPRLLACSANRHFNILPDGTWLAHMEVKDPIPSYLNVNDIQIVIHYFGQPKTCRICGSTGHLARDCKPQEVTESVADPLAFPSLADAYPRSSTNAPNQCFTEPPSTCVTGHLTAIETDAQESCETNETQHTENVADKTSVQDTTYTVNSTEESTENTHNPELPRISTPTPIIKIRTAGTSNPAAARIEKNPKAKVKTKKTPNAAGPPSSMTDPKSKMQLRPTRKRHTTTGTNESPLEEDGKEQDPPQANQDQFIDLDKNYVVTFGAPQQTDELI